MERKAFCAWIPPNHAGPPAIGSCSARAMPVARSMPFLPNAASSPSSAWKLFTAMAPACAVTCRIKASPALISTGSLGHGLSIATGMAFAARLDSRPHRVFALLSDGECDEGSTWEAALFAGHHRLDNLAAIIDYNKIQSLAPVAETLALEPLADKWISFGWAVREVDGHDHGALARILAAVPFKTGKPGGIIAHTVKGKGVSFMENSVLWHYRAARGAELTPPSRNSRPRHVETRSSSSLTGLAARDPSIILLTGDLGYGVLTDFARRFPRQFLNVGVAEQNMTGLATGMALEGRTVFTYSIGNFPTLRCLEQIRNDVCYHRANVKIVSVGCGMSYGALGISHHATEDISILRALPNITLVSPCDRWEAGEATRALAHQPGAALLRLDKSFAPDTVQPGEVFRIGQARTVRQGSDVTLVATGGILGEVLLAAGLLESGSIQCRVISMHTIKPLDVETLAAAAGETGGIVTIEEHSVEGGLGGAVAENLLEAGAPPGFFLRLGLRVGFSQVTGSQQYLRGIHGLDAPAIVQSVRNCLAGAPHQYVARACA